MRISDWSSDVCSSDLVVRAAWAIESCNYAARDIIDMDAAEHLPRRHHPMRVASAHPIARRAAGAVDPGQSAQARPTPQPRDRKRVVQGRRVTVLCEVWGGRILHKQNRQVINKI